ncbi:MAG: bifunctional UDP-N-acetylglucosamine pyrophosphorylase / glucosamine-phosphate N-acetyltransferase [Thermosediminibacterales bacterium]|nr:bifunctional UDP-N-acetylglucosamine pyrophosphorylase / glucosamine-phosphate N-acetyltransferase [Thermosediminibacterales bacterium]
MKYGAAVVLAAGKGTRMKSRKPKVLHKVAGRPMVEYVIKAVKAAGFSKCLVVVGYRASEVKQELGNDVEYVLQKQQLGTAHAVKQTYEALNSDILKNEDFNIMVLNGDTPFITAETLKKVNDFRIENGFTCVVVTAEMDNPTGYGRIIRSEGKELKAIVEEKDASMEEKKIKEINSGIYSFNARLLFSALEEINNDNSQREFYLTDVIKVFRDRGLAVGAYKIKNPFEIIGINNRLHLAEAEKNMRKIILNKLMLSGVTILDPESTYIDEGVEIGRDSIIYPSTFIEGDTKIGENCVIGPHTRIYNSIIENSVEIRESVILESSIGSETKVGPYAHIRPGTEIAQGVKIGDFVELKKSRIGNGSKIPHLAYVGDAHIGQKVNVGAGVIVVNYDGEKKHLTQIEDGAFVGCNTNLIAPVKVGKGAYVAAGSNITDEVPPDSLAIARCRQINKKDWKKKNRKS